MGKDRRPEDIKSSHSKEIVDTVNAFIKGFGEFTMAERTAMILKVADLYKKESEELGLSFLDDEGKRHANSLFGSFEEGHLLQKAQGLHYAIVGIFLGRGSEFAIFFEQLPQRERDIIAAIYTISGSKEILGRNGYGFDPYNPYENKFASAEDEAYCKAVLELTKEIQLRSHNYSKYVEANTTPEKVAELYARIKENLEKNRAEVCKKDPQRVATRPIPEQN